jgi:hypothetical protein
LASFAPDLVGALECRFDFVAAPNSGGSASALD